MKNMKNIIFEEVSRFKLLMSYQNEKTLSENIGEMQLTESVILNEQTSKAFLKAIFGTADDAAINALKTTRNAKYVAGVRLFDDVALTGFRNGDEIMTALINGSLNKSQLSELAKGLMKTGKATGSLRTSLTNKAADMVIKDVRYSNLNQRQIRNNLVKKGYDPSIADEIANKVTIKRGGITPPKPSGSKPSGSKPKRKGGNRTNKTANPNPIPGKEMIWTKFKNRIKGMALRNIVKLLVAAGGVYLLWRWLTDDNNGLFPVCLTSTLSQNDLDTLAQQGLDYIKITETGNKIIDINGGGEFYSDKKFKTGNKKYEGEWSYDGSEIIVTVGGTDYSILCGEKPSIPQPTPQPTPEPTPEPNTGDETLPTSIIPAPTTTTTTTRRVTGWSSTDMDFN